MKRMFAEAMKYLRHLYFRHIYIPANIDINESQHLILYIHGGSFNSGAKEDGDVWCKYYASKGYITATLDYTLQNQGKKADLFFMNNEIKNCVDAINQKCQELGYRVTGMATCGVSAGGTLAMKLCLYQWGIFSNTGEICVPACGTCQL